MHNTNEHIFQDIFTIDDLYAFYKEIDQCVTLLFQSNTTPEQAFSQSFSSQKSDALFTYLQNNSIDIKNPAHIQESLLELKKVAPKFPVVTLKLGYDPTRTHLETFSAWFQNNYNKKVLLEILVERNLLGGAYITHSGLFKDYSLKSKLQKISLKNKALSSKL